MGKYENDLNLKMDEIFGFNLSRSLDGVNYDFGQYKLNQIYRPLVTYFVKEFSEHLESIDESKANEEITLFIDFFKLYFFQGDFGYFKNRYSSFKYKVPYGADYTGSDTELRWASKDCYYVKTSDVVNSIDVQIPRSDLSTDNISLKFFKKTEANDNGDYILSVDSSEILDEDENLIGYNIYVYNWDEAKSKKIEVIMDKLAELQIQAGGGLINSIKDFLNKRGRDYFIHKNLKEFLIGELEWYLFQVLKGDTKGRIDVLEMKNQIEKLKIQHADDPDYIIYKSNEVYAQMDGNIEPSIYQDTYIRCTNFINILSDLEEFKAKLWNKKRKAIKQEYCISLGKIKELETLNPRREYMLQYIFENEKQIKEWKDLGMSNNPTVDDDSLVVDTKNFEGEQRDNLINLVNENSIIGKLYNSDNYQALSYMEENNVGKIDCIYIDPPYNTGNDGFVYKDGFNESTWLSMMNDRLQLAKLMLTNRGTLFSSIDDNEQASLKLLCDNIFGEDLVETNVWSLIDKSESTFEKTAGYTTRKEHEYIITCRNATNIKFNKYKENLSYDNSSFSNPDNDPRGDRFSGNISRTGIKTTTGSKYYTITTPNGTEYTRNWTLSKEEFEEALKDNRIYFPKDGEGVPRYKIFASDSKGTIQSSIFSGLKTSISGKNALKQLFGDLPFSYPKPVELISRLIELIGDENSSVLDFFAGSGTTGHAVLRLNKEDGGHRKFIEVELGKYFDDITLIRAKKIQYSQNWKDGKAVDNDGTQGIIEYTKLNQYEDWFSTDGYLTLLDEDIQKLGELEDIENITQIISPLEDLKERIYNIDDMLSNDQLLEISNNK